MAKKKPLEKNESDEYECEECNEKKVTLECSGCGLVYCTDCAEGNEWLKCKDCADVDIWCEECAMDEGEHQCLDAVIEEATCNFRDNQLVTYKKKK